MLTNSRAVATASAMAADRASVALVSFVRGDGTRSSTRASGCESGPGAVMDDLNSVKLYAPNANPSAAAPRSRIESVVATVSMPDNERAAGAGGLTDLLAAELVGGAESDGENAGDRQFARCRDTSELLGLAGGADGDEAVEDLGEYVFGDDAFAECDFGAVRARRQTDDQYLCALGDCAGENEVGSQRSGCASAQGVSCEVSVRCVRFWRMPESMLGPLPFCGRAIVTAG